MPAERMRPMWHTLYPVRADADGGDDIASFLEAGLDAGERAVVVLDGDVRDAALARLARSRRWAGDALHLFGVDDVYGPDGRIDAPAQRATFEKMLEQALVEGYSGLRVAGDVTPVAIRHPDDLIVWERTADDFEAYSPVTGMCVIDTRRVPDDVVEVVDVMHPASRHSTAVFHLHAGAANAVALTGDVDAFDAELLARTLRTLSRAAVGRTSVIDVSGVTLMSHQALRVLELAAADLGTNVVLRNAPNGVLRLASVLPLDHLEVTA